MSAAQVVLKTTPGSTPVAAEVNTTQNCGASSHSGYNFGALNHGASETQEKNTTVSNGTKKTSIAAVCNN